MTIETVIAIEDLEAIERDAERYRWLREPGRSIFGNAGDAICVDGASPEQIDGLIDDEIAKDKY